MLKSTTSRRRFAALAAGLVVASPVALTTHTADAACARYPASVVTTTDVTLRQAMGTPRTRNVATAVIRSNVRVPRRGLVVFRVVGTGKSAAFELTPADNGTIRWRMPRLSVGSYKVRATYVPGRCSQLRTSADVARYRVISG